jgi:sec-independent protein translocase protein TatA
LIGWQELIIVLVIVMLIFGTSKISGIGKSLGTAIRDFRDSMKSEPPEEDKSPGQSSPEENPKEAGKSNE